MSNKHMKRSKIKVKKTEDNVIRGYVLSAQVKKKHQLILIDVNLKGKPCHALIDTGASRSLISSEMNNDALLPIDISLHSASGHALPIMGTVNKLFKIGGKSYDHKFYVVQQNTLPVSMILGWDFISSINMKFKTKPLKMKIDGQEIVVKTNKSLKEKINLATYLEEFDEWRNITFRMYSKKNENSSGLTSRDFKSCYATTDKETVINGNEAGFLRLNLHSTRFKIETGTNVLYEPFQNNKGKFTSQAVCRVRGSEDLPYIMVPYINFNVEPVIIREHKRIGEAHILEVEPSFEPILLNTPSTNVERTEEERKEILNEEVDKLFKPNTRENKFLKKQVDKYPKIFKLEDEPANISDIHIYSIKLLDEEPVYKAPYPIPEKVREQVESQIQDMLTQGLIEPSTSKFNAPLCVVRKANEKKMRICVDFTKTNLKVIDDRYPLPNLNTIFYSLRGNKYFSSLDISGAFHQIKLDEKSKKYTAFTTNNQKYQFRVLPMGLKSASSAFQRIIDGVLYGLTGKICKIFIDDVLILGTNFDEHCKNIENVFERLHKAQLTLRLIKCKFFQKSTKFLGHIVSEHGLRKQPEKLEKIKQMTFPKTLKELLSFLGSTGYYRRFCPSYAEIALPLTDLSRGGTKKMLRQTKVSWSPKGQSTFDKVKEALCEDNLLSHPDFDKPFHITTKAYDKTVEGRLEQKNDEGELKPILYFSKKLNKAQQNYTQEEKELYGILNALRQCRYITLGYDTMIETDATCIRKVYGENKKEKSRLVRWKMELLENTHIRIKTGKQLYRSIEEILGEIQRHLEQSRKQQEDNDVEANKTAEKAQKGEKLTTRTKESSLKVVSAHSSDNELKSSNITSSDFDVVLSSNVVAQEHYHKIAEGLEELCRNKNCKKQVEYINAVTKKKKSKRQKDEEATNMELWDIDQIKLLQRRDPTCQLIRKHIDGTLSKEEEQNLSKIIHKFKTMEFIQLDEVIYKLVRSVRNEYRVRHAIYTPEPMRNTALKMAHEDHLNKHVGTRRTKERLQEFAYWPRQNTDVDQFVKSCEVCNKKKPQYSTTPKLRFRGQVHSWDRVHVNIIKLDKSETGPKYVMTLIDEMTNFLIAIPIRKLEVEEIAKQIANNIFGPNGYIKSVVTDLQ